MHKSFQIHGKTKDEKEGLSEVKRLRKNSLGKGGSTRPRVGEVMTGMEVNCGQGRQRLDPGRPDKLIPSVKVLKLSQKA